MAQPAFVPSPRDRSIAVQLHDELKRFISALKETDPNIESIAAHVLALETLSKEAERTSYPILHETGQIVQNIISQSLLIPGITSTISVLKAAEIHSKDPTSLQIVLSTFKQYSETTRILIQELELLSRDLIF